MRKIICSLIILCMLFIYTTPIRANAQDKIPPNKAIEIAKSAFDINTEGLSFKQNYIENMNGRKIYELNWYSKKQTGENIYVSVDAETGEIISMSMSDGSVYSNNRIPKYSKSSAQKVASDLIIKLQPQKYKELKLDDKQRSIYGYDSYSDVYTFNFIRVANGIEFSDNGITVSVDKNNLKIRSYNLNWDNITLPDSSNAISIDTAKNIFKDKLGLELAYSMVYNSKLSKNVPILVYSLKNGNMPIDAVTGNIIKNGYYIPFIKNGDTNSKDSTQAPQLTNEEQKEIDLTSKYITKEKAIEIAKQYLPLDDKYNLTNANLYSYSLDDDAAWYLYWENSNPSTNTYNYMSAKVDALTSEIKSFYFGGSDFDQPSKDKKPLYDKEQSKKIAEEFIKSVYPDKFNQIESRDNEYYISNDLNYISPIYYFRYIRKTDDIVYNFDTININVNCYTGKVCGFNISWSTKLNLPSKNDTINIEDAYNILFEKLNFSLKYVKCYNYINPNSKPQIKLAYVLDSFSGMLDAKSGYVLDYNGDPINEKNSATAEYTDIKGNPNENSIKLLAELGILKDSSDKFRPDDKILQKDFIKLLVLSTDPYISDDNSYDVYYKQAISKNIISENEKSPDSEVTRQQAAKIIVNSLGLGLVANKPDMYDISKIKDANMISQDYKGYIAIISELKIMPLDNDFFNPLNTITRGDAATIIVNYLNSLDTK
ncbi:peptidase M4 [Caloramator sp. E03]|uniref:YcdB/YcdC domain-containing protein n=1 Tax=Caloramator sp. E03 TaxID=2576307 RepID=UPI00111008F8|nr:YcdB/YcdC domain-containing protein [Caloramator sp. E03]QCX33705.1 peptidase M4 [Caloramator sp. E03]